MNKLFRRYYYIGIGLYIFSFFLPATKFLEKWRFVHGYECAWFTLQLLKDYDGVLSYMFLIYVNLANVLTVIVFILHFKINIKKLYIVQLAAFLSAVYWIVPAIFRDSFFPLYIGYYAWAFSILYISIVMWRFRHTANITEGDKEVVEDGGTGDESVK